MNRHFGWCGGAVLAAAMVFGPGAGAFAATDAGIEIRDAWARATVPGQPVAGAYAELTSAKAVQLVGISTPAAKRGELHEMKHVDGVMKMRQLKSLSLPAGETVKPAPGGLHLMLFGLPKPLAAGSTIPLTFSFKLPGGKIVKKTVDAQVRAVDAGGDGHGGHDMGHDKGAAQGADEHAGHHGK